MLGRGWLWLPPPCLEQAQLSSASIWGLQPPRLPVGLGWPKCGSKVCSVGRDGSSLPGDKAGDREVQLGERGLVMPPLRYSCVHAGFPFPPALWVALQPD